MLKIESMIKYISCNDSNLGCLKPFRSNFSSSTVVFSSQQDFRKLKGQSGFTLIEVMLVVVIAAIFAAMIGLSIGGSETRRVFQEREELMGSIAEISLESQDQSRMLGFISLNQTATDPARYIVVEYDPTATDKNKKWKPATDFKVHALPSSVEVTVTPLQNTVQNPSAHFNDITSGELSPKLIWFGNGEATPVRLQLLLDGQNVGDAIEITSLGKVKKDETRRSSSENGQ
jgi:general secretion pathway protein G